MYGIRKFVNHIYKTTTHKPYYRIDIYVSKYKYAIHNTPKTYITIYIDMLRYIDISDHVINYEKKYIYDYRYIKNNKLMMGNDEIDITIIDDGIHITLYYVSGDYVNNIVIIHDNVLIF